MTDWPVRVVVTLKVELTPKASAGSTALEFWHEQAGLMADQALRAFQNDQAFTTRVLTRVVASPD